VKIIQYGSFFNPEISGNIADTFESKELFQAFQSLTDVQKEVINDLFQNDLSIEEIAEKRNITKKSVWEIKDRAIKALRARLKGGETYE